MDSENINNIQPVRINPAAFVNKGLPPKQVDKASQSFDEILFGKLNNRNSVLFSKHASKRLEEREINLSEKQMERLEKGVKEAQKKGIKDSLVMVDNIYLVVNTKNKTVITAVGNDGNESIFTNIDGAVIV